MPMLIAMRFGPGIRDGSITVTFRRWKRRQVVAGRRYRTAIGRIDVTEVDEVSQADITRADARRAGYPSVEALVADLRGAEGDPIFRVRFTAVDDDVEPDPRAVLAADDALGPDDLDELMARLRRLERSNPRGAWTEATLRQIARRPAVRAPDLADDAGVETARYKLDVRKLKALGLTISLERGYRLSPRGEAYLRALDAKPT